LSNSGVTCVKKGLEIKWSIQKMLKFNSFIFIAGMLSGCSVLPGKDVPVEQQVAGRVQSYWNATVTGDHKTTYGLMTPGYRERLSYEQHVALSQPFAKFLSAKILKVDCAQPNSCQVDIQLIYKDINIGKRVIKGEQSSTFQDRWIQEDGRWWRFPPR